MEINKKEEIQIPKDSFINKLQSVSNLDPYLVLSWLAGLTNLEQKVLSTLYNLNSAATIKLIKFTIIVNSTQYFSSIHLREELNFPFKSYYPISQEKKDEISKESSLIDKVGRLSELCSFPSFRTIDNTIKDLISLGIIMKRDSHNENKKIKGYFYLNPFIRSQLDKIKRIEKEK